MRRRAITFAKSLIRTACDVLCYGWLSPEIMILFGDNFTRDFVIGIGFSVRGQTTRNMGTNPKGFLDSGGFLKITLITFITKKKKNLLS